MYYKGGWETDETAEEAACREAFEEAGVQGELKVRKTTVFPWAPELQISVN